MNLTKRPKIHLFYNSSKQYFITGFQIWVESTILPIFGIKLGKYFFYQLQHLCS
jgi:hypothetical protein